MPSKGKKSTKLSGITNLALGFVLEIVNIIIVLEFLFNNVVLLAIIPSPFNLTVLFLLPISVGVLFRKRLTGWYVLGIILAVVAIVWNIVPRQGAP